MNKDTNCPVCGFDLVKHTQLHKHIEELERELTDKSQHIERLWVAFCRVLDEDPVLSRQNVCAGGMMDWNELDTYGIDTRHGGMCKTVGCPDNHNYYDVEEADVCFRALDERIEELKAARDSEIEECRKWSERNMDLQDELKARERQAAQRGARMQIMMEWMDGNMPKWKDTLWRDFLRNYPEANDWFDEDGVPVREE